MRKFWPFRAAGAPATGLKPDLAITGDGPSFSNTSAIGGWPQNPAELNALFAAVEPHYPAPVMETRLWTLLMGSSNKKQSATTYQCCLDARARRHSIVACFLPSATWMAGRTSTPPSTIRFARTW
jgi:hypothetical protein